MLQAIYCPHSHFPPGIRLIISSTGSCQLIIINSSAFLTVNMMLPVFSLLPPFCTWYTMDLCSSVLTFSRHTPSRSSLLQSILLPYVSFYRLFQKIFFTLSLAAKSRVFSAFFYTDVFISSFLRNRKFTTLVHHISCHAFIYILVLSQALIISS